MIQASVMLVCSMSDLVMAACSGRVAPSGWEVGGVFGCACLDISAAHLLHVSNLHQPTPYELLSLVATACGGVVLLFQQKSNASSSHLVRLRHLREASETNGRQRLSLAGLTSDISA
jgi:hypothetical protein